MENQYLKTDINNRDTWTYPNMLSGITIVRKENVTEEEIYRIYKYCIEIQQKSQINKIKEDKYNLKIES